jgi:hypothetical protein
MGLKRHAERIDPNALVAQRIKRLASIRLKLELNRGMRLSRMQDIGGCRAVVGSVNAVGALVKSYMTSDVKHSLVKEDNYIIHPKRSGYRSHHLIYKYFSDKNATHNGLRIELQIRSLLQHAWATAVEIVGTFIRQALKSSQGEEDWLRFFQLMGAAIARREDTPIVPGTPGDAATLVGEVREYVTRLDVRARLQAYGAALQVIDYPHIEDSDYYLLELDPEKMTVNVQGYTKAQLGHAAAQYLEIEKRIANSTHDAVLVSADSMMQLRRAYPNYFLDTSRFLEVVEETIAKD